MCCSIKSLAVVLLCATCHSLTGLRADEPTPPRDTRRAEELLTRYFAQETASIENDCLAGIDSADAWLSRRDEYRRQLREMLGLDPLPERGELKPQVTGVVERGEIRVEKLHFQSSPGLYVTGNLYLPKRHDGPLPAVLYVCGHGPVKIDGVSYGNKVTYQHHGAWFARHGFACLTIDSLQLGEIEGVHHGTHSKDRWWWTSRGYTPAGVEAWNCVRAIDYLQTRPEIDPHRIGVTGRSGGGAYSWWIAAIDERIQAAAPVAGITDLRNHVIDGCVDGHCDCMYFVNAYRWDYPMVAALVAPRPLLVVNTDDDGIFPLDGVVRTFEKTRRVYDLLGARDKLGLAIGPGPHKDTQDLQVPAFRWLMRHLKGDETPIAAPAEKLFTPQELQVFEKLPPDEKNSSIDESFVVAAALAAVPASESQWQAQCEAWRASLLEKTFRGWPKKIETPSPELKSSHIRGTLRSDRYRYFSHGEVELDLVVVTRQDGEKPKSIVLRVLDDEEWTKLNADSRLIDQTLADSPRSAPVFATPRGIGPSTWTTDPSRLNAIRRRFYLLGQTLEGMQVLDIRAAVLAARKMCGDLPVTLESRGAMAEVALYAAIFSEGVTSLELHDLAPSHRDRTPLLNVQRMFDIPQAVALAAERANVVLHDDSPDKWSYPRDIAATLNWPENRFQIAY